MRRIVPALFAFAIACDGSSPSGADGGGTDGSVGDGTVGQDGPANDSGGDSSKPPETCIGSNFLGALGKDHVIVGGVMQDATAALAPFELRYTYISGGLFDGPTPCTNCQTCTANGMTCKNPSGCAWWGCWQSDTLPSGEYTRGFVKKVSGAAMLPMLPYYQLLQASKVQEGGPEVNVAAKDQAFMARYLADWRVLMQAVGSTKTLVHIEPDFWGYAEQLNEDPHALPAAVASANPTDCGTQENSIAGMARCMIAMTRKYAPNAMVALHASSWGTKMPALYNKNPAFDLNGDATKLAAFLLKCGADQGDAIVLDIADRDAGLAQSQGNMNAWWDATNAALPHFHQGFAWMKILAENLKLPIVLWQIPIGNVGLANQNNVWRDNRLDYFFAHMDEVAAAHVAAIAYGGGIGGCTSAETDGGNFVAKMKAYAQSPQKLCP